MQLLTGTPLERLRFHILNPHRLLIRVGVGIIGMEIACPALFLFICRGSFWMRAQIVPKSEMKFDLWRFFLKEVKLRETQAIFVGKGAVAPSAYAELAVPTVP